MMRADPNELIWMSATMQTDYLSALEPLEEELLVSRERKVNSSLAECEPKNRSK